MGRIVLDTNSLIQSIPSRSPYRPDMELIYGWDEYLMCLRGNLE